MEREKKGRIMLLLKWVAKKDGKKVRPLDPKRQRARDCFRRQKSTGNYFFPDINAVLNTG